MLIRSRLFPGSISPATSLAQLASGEVGIWRSFFLYGLLGILPLAILSRYALMAEIMTLHVTTLFFMAVLSAYVITGLWNQKTNSFAGRFFGKCVGLLYLLQCLGQFIVGVAILSV